MNQSSSRSHTIFTIMLQSCKSDKDVQNYFYSWFNFVDLAGSERQKQTKTQGIQFKEGCQINKSLSVLGSCINSLSDQNKKDKNSHIRYRDSKLTFLLKNSLGGNSKTAFIANITFSPNFILETLSTLHFASRAKLIKN